jgi:hypothetical protein
MVKKKKKKKSSRPKRSALGVKRGKTSRAGRGDKYKSRGISAPADSGGDDGGDGEGGR